VTVASNGASGVSLANRSAPDLILLDIHMPGETGIDCLRRLKRVEKIRAIPVIMLTSDASGEAVQACLRAGAADYILKPMTREYLLERVGLRIREAAERLA
jgi:putative two-component system response regulator